MNVVATNMDKLRIAGIVGESIVDGPGIRMSIFVQGCPHHCDGCHNAHTWDFDGGNEIDTDEIIAKALKNPLIKGITLSGGEPFCQAKALTKIAKAVKENGLDVFAYSGYTFEELLNGFDKHIEWQELLNQCDYLVDGKFVQAEKSLNLRFRGSKNQRILDVKKSLESGVAVLSEYN